MLSILNLCRLLLISLLFTVNTATAAEEKPTVDLQKNFDQLQVVFNRSIDKASIFEQNLELIEAEQKKYSAFNIKLDECIANNTEKLTSIKSNITVLGEKNITEDTEIKTQRIELETELQSIDNQLKRCNILKIQLKEISDKTSTKRLGLLKQRLYNKEISVITAFTQGSYNISSFEPVIKALKGLFTWKILAALLLGLFLGWFWKRYNPKHTIDATQHASPSLSAVMRGIRRIAPILLALLFIWLVLKTQSPQQLHLVTIAGFALALTFAFATLIGTLFPQPISERNNKAPLYKFLTFSYVTIIFSTFAFALNEPSLGRFTNSNILYLTWLACMTISSVSFIRALQISIQNLFNQSSKGFYLYIPIVILISLTVTSILGYRNLSSLLFFGLILSLKTLFFMFLSLRISSEFFDSIDEGKIAWQIKLRTLMSLKSGQAFPGVLWFRVLVFFAVVFMGISSFVAVWGGPQQPIASLQGIWQNGLNIGSLNFNVFNIIFALLVMVTTLSIRPFIKNKLIDGWLKHSNLSSGAKDATKTLVGYVVLAIATLWALFILGMKFQNLAIIAGALSVGIGFGLQNIVNNFVSGLILLFERPIRRGDWVVVGGTEGYVRNISIRSTTIQTFDKADVIVPNSELISNQVTNWMLSSNIGRLKAAVGVAYGSDVTKVMDILMKITEDHPGIISHNPSYATRVLFQAFGDNSLDFEIRCFIREIEDGVIIRSEVNIAIDAAFREHNIEIPFPQRVIHMPSDSDH